MGEGVSRREILKVAAAAVPLVLLAPPWIEHLWAARTFEAQAGAGMFQRVLILVELQGGNDGLNTVVPYEDRAYSRARPKLGIPRDQVRQLSSHFGLHPALTPLMPSWDAKELAIVAGVGYPRPNRSHFRSIEIWETGSESEQVLDEGWLSQVFRRFPVPADFAAEGILLGKGDAGPFSGGQRRAIALRDPEEFLRRAGSVHPVSAPVSNRALAHILEVQREIWKAAGDLQARMRQVPELGIEFPAHKIGKQLQVAAQLLAARVPVAVVKVSHGSFDTHAGQLPHHHRLLEELAEGLTAFRSAMVRHGRWRDLLVMTYSEFGRRVEENASHGTDHGTAAPHVMIGGQVKGGLYGTYPSLTDLEDGDLKYTVDYRSLYATVIERWWGLSATMLVQGRYPALDCLTG
jgi:uncharacterized protein (DUF1501 family)